MSERGKKEEDGIDRSPSAATPAPERAGGEAGGGEPSGGRGARTKGGKGPIRDLLGRFSEQTGAHFE